MADLSTVTSVTISGRSVFGNKRVTWGYITLGDNSKTVPSAGLSVASSNFGMVTAENVMLSNHLYPYDWASEVLKSGTGSNVPASADKVYFFATGYGLAS